MTISVGDWVRSCSPGIWQVVRVVPEHYALRYSLDAPQKLAEEPLLVLKRVVGDKWKKAFAPEVVGASAVRQLSKADSARLNKLLQSDDQLSQDFEKYSQPLDLILNLSFALPKKSDFGGFKKEFEKAFARPLEKGLTSDGIVEVIASSKYASHFNEIPRNATLQFASKDLEVKRKHFIYRTLQVHNF
jgi:hypothetical protein